MERDIVWRAYQDYTAAWKAVWNARVASNWAETPEVEAARKLEDEAFYHWEECKRKYPREPTLVNHNGGTGRWV